MDQCRYRRFSRHSRYSGLWPRDTQTAAGWHAPVAASGRPRFRPPRPLWYDFFPTVTLL